MWIIAIIVSLTLVFSAWWAWTAEWYDKLMSWVELIFLIVLIVVLAVGSIALAFTFEPLAYIVITINMIAISGLGFLADKTHKHIKRL
jgi:hypothetical protein